jgi:hypothetical protein
MLRVEGRCEVGCEEGGNVLNSDVRDHLLWIGGCANLQLKLAPSHTGNLDRLQSRTSSLS